ncbi:hypothetical protein TrLO_g15256 [Triparma laevis f. longispina]|uniref:Neurotransmitter-gated ion-channel ligand-binding domain-containing protein n=1 Tax=Triparma laevis f. longispina TaxID=1714387 RepID=A0A9W7DWP1_9STRA|nr:hypothetical protein TrLO_g15256 [Triparma laevis f. longispina]
MMKMPRDGRSFHKVDDHEFHDEHDPTIADKFNPNPVPAQAVLILTHAPEVKGNTMDIDFRIQIIKIRGIRADNAADVIFLATQTWHLPEIKKIFEKTKSNELPTMNSVPDAWFPPLICLNADKLEEQASKPTVDWKKGNVERKVYFNGTVTNELSQIRLFPFDWDDLRIICTADINAADRRATAVRYMLVPEESWSPRQMVPYYVEQSVQEWEIIVNMSTIGKWNQELYKHKYIEQKEKRKHSHFNPKGNLFGSVKKIEINREAEETNDQNRASNVNLPPRESAIARSMSGVEVTIHVRRRFEYYVYKIILVFNLIIFMSWAVNASGHNEFLSRMEVIATSATALFAFIYSVQQDLPKLPFLTFIDKLMISGIFCLAAQTMQAVISHKIDDWTDMNIGSVVDGYCSLGIPCLYITYNTYIANLVLRARSHDAMLEVRSQRRNMGEEHGVKALKLMGM